MSIYIGLDPGKKGAMAIIGYSHETGETYMCKIIPYDPQEYIKVLKQYNNATVCIEQVHSISKQGIASSFTFGSMYGWLLGVLDAIGVSYQTVSPQKWKKHFGLNSDKAKSVEVCKHLLPQADLRRTDRCRKDDDGMAEAALLAIYAKRNY